MPNNLNDLFFQSQQPDLDYDELLKNVQESCTANYSAEISAAKNQTESAELLHRIIRQYLFEHKYGTTDALIERLYEDMAGYSFIQKYLEMPGIEEININAFDDVAIITDGGRSRKIPERFSSPQQAIDVIRRMLANCQMIIDDTMPSVLGYLSKNVRISVDKTPLVDAETGISASIRVINPKSISRETLLQCGSATEEMLDFLVACMIYGVSVCLVGATSSGKSTIMAWLLSNVPDDYRLITIEDESREFDLVKRDESGRVLNNVVHLQTRPHENPKLDIDQDFLLERVLRKHPDIIGIGEIRAAAETMSAAEASRTGHTCITTLHANSCRASYRRMATLAKRKFTTMDNAFLEEIMVEAYPIVARIKQQDDGSRRIMEIMEGEGYEDGRLVCRTLYKYHRQKGGFQKTNRISEALEDRFLESGIPKALLDRFLKLPRREVKNLENRVVAGTREK